MVYTFVMSTNPNEILIGSRPPLPEEYLQKIKEVAARLNEDALIPLTGHDALLLLIDRGHAAFFPEKHQDGKRKKFYRIPF